MYKPGKKFPNDVRAFFINHHRVPYTEQKALRKHTGVQAYTGHRSQVFFSGVYYRNAFFFFAFAMKTQGGSGFPPPKGTSVHCPWSLAFVP